MNIEEIKSNINVLLNELGYKLNLFNFAKEEGQYVMHIEIDRDESISMDDIVKVSNELSNKLDTLDLGDTPYVLDVCSSGIEKPIEVNDLVNHLNDYVNIHLIEPYKGENFIEGTIVEVDTNSITLKYFIKGAKKSLKVELTNIDKARKAIKF